jgi:monoamine oxidase
MAHSQIMSHVNRAMRIAQFCEEHRMRTSEGLERVAALEHARQLRLSRRQVLVGAGAACVGWALGAWPFVDRIQAAKTSRARIAIVGGGLAGLVCAYELQRKGVLATIYEGNPDRVGGRCHSARGTFPGQVAELGGEMIDTLGKTMLGYAREFKLGREEYGKEPGEPTYYFHGQHYTEREIVAEYRELVTRMRQDLQTLSRRPTAATHTSADVALDRTDLATYLSTRGRGLPLIQAVLGQAYLVEYGRELHEQSCLNFLLFIHADRRAKLAEYGIFSDERYHLVEGNDAVPAQIRSRLQGAVEMGAFLQRLSRNASGHYELQFKGAASPAIADAVVLAIPYSVLRTVTLDASVGLSADKRRAINELGYGYNTKTAVGFVGRPWFEQHRRNGASYSDLPSIQNTWETNYTRAKATSILTEYAGGNRARSLDRLSPSDGSCLACHGSPNFLPADLRKAIPQAQTQRFLTDLDTMFPGAHAAASRDADGAYLVRRGHWVNQSYSFGSYSCYLPGQFTSLAGLEGQSAGLLKFAGEHANSFYDWQGFMEGAALSGQAAAKEVLGDMGAGRL